MVVCSIVKYKSIKFGIMSDCVAVYGSNVAYTFQVNLRDYVIKQFQVPKNKKFKYSHGKGVGGLGG